MLPYLGGERTPNLPDATGSLLDLVEGAATPELVLRAAVDGVAAGLAYCQDALNELGVRKRQVTLVGGGASHPTWQQAIADATGLPLTVRAGGEHAARGSAIQAAAIALGEPVEALAGRWRPDVVAEVTPRPEHHAAFRLDERRRMIDGLFASRRSDSLVIM